MDIGIVSKLNCYRTYANLNVTGKDYGKRQKNESDKWRSI